MCIAHTNLTKEDNNHSVSIQHEVQARSHFSTLTDDHWEFRLIIRARGNVLNLPYNEEAFHNLPKHNMLSIEKVTLGTGNKELAAVGVGSTVGQGEQPRGVMFQLEVLICEYGSVDAH